jgi:hypothetical protein
VLPFRGLGPLESALALHDYRLLEKQEGVWIVIPDPSVAISAAYYNVRMVPYTGIVREQSRPLGRKKKLSGPLKATALNRKHGAGK